METWHALVTTDHLGPVWREDERLVAATSALANSGGDRVLLFCLLQDHGHVVLAGNRRAVRRRVAAITRALSSTMPRPAGLRLFPVERREHLEVLVRFICLQPQAHHLSRHPASWAGSCVQDLLGARRLRGFDGDAIRRAMPELTAARVARNVDLRVPLPSQVNWHAVDGRKLVSTAAAAIGVRDLTGLRADVVAMRRAVLSLGLRHRVELSCLREALDLTGSTYHRSLRRSADGDSVRLLATRLALQQQLDSS